MLTLYYARPSLYSRPVWLALLEKGLPFELVAVKMDGEQFEPEFMTLNPFSHIPVLVDDEFCVIESSAILDYLETKYPTPALLPSEPQSLATVRMVQMVALNELLPAVFGLIVHDKEELEYAKYRASNVLTYFESLLQQSYFSGEQLTLADIVAGTLVPDLPKLGLSLASYPRVNQWAERLKQREAWQQIQLSAEELERFRRNLRVLAKRVWSQRRRQRMVTWSQQETSR